MEESELIQKLRDEVAKLGANAVILLGSESEDMGGVIGNNVWLTFEKSVVRGLAIDLD